MPVQPLQILLAMKALMLAPGLKGSERRVGVAILEHYNRRDGRCDPSIERIAALLDVEPKTVRRAVNRLELLGYFIVTRHGGRHGTNFYEPNWDLFLEEERAWRRKFSAKAVARRTIESPSNGHSGPKTGDRDVRQTQLQNQLKEPASGGGAKLRPRRRPPRRR